MSTHHKCEECSINIPLCDIEEYMERKECPFNRAKCPFKQVKEEQVGAFAAKRESGTEGAVSKSERRRKVWVELEGARGKKYYHNTVTGKDQWDKPPDFEQAETVAPRMLSKPEGTRSTLLAAQEKLDMERQGVPKALIDLQMSKHNVVQQAKLTEQEDAREDRREAGREDRREAEREDRREDEREEKQQWCALT